MSLKTIRPVLRVAPLDAGHNDDQQNPNSRAVNRRQFDDGDKFSMGATGLFVKIKQQGNADDSASAAQKKTKRTELLEYERLRELLRQDLEHGEQNVATVAATSYDDEFANV